MAAFVTAPEPDEILHASCAALNNTAVLIRGASGSGKSSLTLELLARGAQLVSDDRTCLIRRERRVIAYAPDPLLGLIEARGVGILRADSAGPSPVALVVDLDQTATERLPVPQSCDLLGQQLPLLSNANEPHFASAVLQYLRAGPWIPS